MDLDRVFKLLAAAHALSHQRDYVIIGSNSVLAFTPETRIPAEMTMSLDIDAFTKADPAKIFDLGTALGEQSEFRRREGYFLDPVSPALPTLPAGWESRLLLRERGEIRAWFLDPNDAALSKYARGEARDLRWIRAGIKSGLVSLPVIRQRLAQTRFADDAERKRTLAQIEADAKWFASLRK